MSYLPDTNATGKPPRGGFPSRAATASLRARIARARRGQSPLETVSAVAGGVALGVAVLALLVMVFLITLNVILRVVGVSQIKGVDEITGLLLLLVVFLPAADVMRRGEHINVDVVTRRLPARVSWTLRAITYLIGLGYVGVFCWQAIDYHRTIGLLGQKTAVLLVPLDRVTPFMIAGLAVLGLQLVALLVRHLTTWPGEAAQVPHAAGGEELLADVETESRRAG